MGRTETKGGGNKMLKWKKKEWEENQAGVINPISHIGNGKIGDMEVELSWHPNGLHFDVEDRRAIYRHMMSGEMSGMGHVHYAR